MPSASIHDPRNVALAQVARDHGMKNALRIVVEAKDAGIPVSLGLAMVEQETTDGSNVFGHDNTIFVGAGEVTEGKYLAYRRQRGPTGRGGMQGVGPMQLTWYEYQDRADKLGGCWLPKCSIRVGFQVLATNIHAKGKHNGVKSYNGTGAAAEEYADEVLDVRMPKWHALLAKVGG